MSRKMTCLPRALSSVGGQSSSGLPLPSPLGRSSPALSASTTISHRPQLSAGARSSVGLNRSLLSPVANSTNWVKVKDQTPPSLLAAKRQSVGLDSSPMTPTDESRSARPRAQRPSTNMAGSRRISMLPLPRGFGTIPSNSSGGQESWTCCKSRFFWPHVLVTWPSLSLCLSRTGSIMLSFEVYTQPECIFAPD